MTQMALPLAWPADPRDDAFLVTPSNAPAARLLEQWDSWPVRTAILTGPRRSGRSLLARIFAGKSGGAIIDDAERLSEAELFHAWNRAQEDGRPLVIVADAAPPAWSVRLPDLRSRLSLSPHAVIDVPDDALVRALLDHYFARAHLDARPDLIEWIAARIERSHLSVERAVDAVDQATMERRARPTIPLARAALAACSLIASAPEEP
jgi:hypothetical protein